MDPELNRIVGGVRAALPRDFQKGEGMSDTPLCDAREFPAADTRDFTAIDLVSNPVSVVPADFARDLERQLAAVTADLAASKERVARVVDISEGMAIELAAAREDAERWRRARRHGVLKLGTPVSTEFVYNDEADAYMDPARSAEQQHKGEGNG